MRNGGGTKKGAYSHGSTKTNNATRVVQTGRSRTQNVSTHYPSKSHCAQVEAHRRSGSSKSVLVRNFLHWTKAIPAQIVGRKKPGLEVGLIDTLRCGARTRAGALSISDDANGPVHDGLLAA
jgi:hypothetical protein